MKPIKLKLTFIEQNPYLISTKYGEVFSDTKNYYLDRKKSGQLNNLSNVWKTITVNLNASDGEYFNVYTNKIT